MVTSRDKTISIRSRLTTWITMRESGLRHRLYRLLWSELSAPLVALTIIFLSLIGVELLSFVKPQYAGWSPAAELALLLSAAITIGFILYRVSHRLVEPLEHLRNWASRIRGGNLSAKIAAPLEGSFAKLAHDINSFSEELKSLKLDMDSRVRAQTVRIARKTQSLDILYDVATSLTEAGSLDKQLGSFLDTFIELVDARAASVRVLMENGQTRLIASRGLEPEVVERDRLMEPICQCGWAATKGGIRIQHGTRECTKLIGVPMLKKDCKDFVVVPVQYQDRILGVYNLFLDRPLTTLGEDVHDLLVSVGKHLGLAIVKARLDNDARRLAIMEERNMLGNELHDSLAQSLVGMRLQVKMLGETLHKKDVRVAQNEVRSLREAIEEAHTSLRELLANFRLKIDEGGLIPSLNNMIKRFNQETGISVFLQNEITNLNLSPAEEIQVFHITQEALTNIRKHSQACNARVLLTENTDGRYAILIEDDGYGMVPSQTGTSAEHMGLSVMRDRAQRIHGELTIESEPGEGTRIFLTFGTISGAENSQVYGG